MRGAYLSLRERKRAMIRSEAARCMRAATAYGGHSIKQRIDALARQLGWPFGRTEDIWRGEAISIEAWEMDHAYPVDAYRYLC